MDKKQALIKNIHNLKKRIETTRNHDLGISITNLELVVDNW